MFEFAVVSFTLNPVAYIRSAYSDTSQVPKATPVLDVKPYLSSIPEEKLKRGWLDDVTARAR